ncbi:glycosyltransferase family 2 protein [Planktothrix sp. FACHB-1355]|uniref:Glycosyltransferase family 2 protein n=1 Tax=Aerosakkonema funiforme FACHB-1375 TaxID=2949571 RepID=A0A926ZMP4_9CYAN|nr:glycosyltransferase family 2 protein [Aerosakkonema funiforme FACHB-1375]MBD3560602.1 glycosyltransferase family 2 protein [Planktothrix sp. FACHB-1355]
MKFSIAITTYNRLSLLKRAIDSALAQTVPCEVVVADDCSSDETEAYLRSLGDRIVYHRNASNMGHAVTMNAAVKAASGDWVKPVDDDDYLAPNCIEEMTRALILRPQAVICSCQAAQVDVNRVEISRTRKTGPGKVFYIPQEDIHYGMLMEQIPFGTPIQVAFRRDAFLKSGGWDSQLDVNFDDIDSWLKIAQFGDAVFMNQCLAYRTVWPGGYNQKFSVQKRLDTHILIKDKLYDLVSEKYTATLPDRQTIRDYLKLHWALVAAKQKQTIAALKTIFPAIFSLAAWHLLVTAMLARKSQDYLQEKRLYGNILVMAKLYALLGKNYSYGIENFETLRAYLRLRYSWSACQQGKFLSAITIALPSLLSLPGWQMFVLFLLAQKFNSKPMIHKLVLIE